MRLFHAPLRLLATMSTSISTSTTLTSMRTERTVFSLAVTGGGVSAVQWLFARPGASAHLLFAEVPYSKPAMDSFLRRELKSSQSCSRSAAREISEEALRKTCSLLLVDGRSWSALAIMRVIGLSCTAALVSGAPKKGKHRCFVGVSDASGTTTLEVVLEKGARDRAGEDAVCSKLILQVLAAQVPADSPSSRFLSDILEDIPSEFSLAESEIPQMEHEPRNVFNDIATKSTDAVYFVERKESNAMVTFSDLTIPAYTFVYSGSFNPLHQGHTLLVAAAINLHTQTLQTEDMKDMKEYEMGQPLVVFELSASNVDKPALNTSEVSRRIEQFKSSNLALQTAGLDNFAVAVTNEPLFTGKAKLFPKCIFVIGSDTLSRLLDPKYYDGSREGVIVALSAIHSLGCTFYVGGRKDANGLFVSAEELLGKAALPTAIYRMFVALSEKQFRVDISSTELRNRAS